jgi:hypothetical protein
VQYVGQQDIKKTKMNQVDKKVLVASLLRKPRGEAVNAACIKQVQAEFLVLFKSKRFGFAVAGMILFYNGITHQVHTDAFVQESQAAKGGKILHRLYLPDIAPVDCFLYQRAKSVLASLCFPRSASR